ncbi:transposase [Segatella oris]|uniref:transposase n=1 Tax=Segatella oris TaxID=28135 RepID=UPI00360B030D
MPYPQAMRERAIAAYLEQGMKKIEVCRIFGIQRRSFDEWLRVYEKEGRTCAKAKYQTTRKEKPDADSCNGNSGITARLYHA